MPAISRMQRQTSRPVTTANAIAAMYRRTPLATRRPQRKAQAEARCERAPMRCASRP
jgi:hypothetical protein